MSNFGIADRIAYVIEDRPLLCFIIATCVWFIGLMFLDAGSWICWIIVSPIIAWQSVVLLIFLGLIETWVYWLLHPKMLFEKIKKDFMKPSTSQFKVICICATVAVVAIGAMLVLRQTSSKSDAPPKYFAVHISKQQHCIMVHTSPSCNNSHMTLMPAHELYRTAAMRHGTWTVKYNGETNFPMRFCAKCVTPAQMDAICDTVANFDEHLFDGNIEELREFRNQQQASTTAL